MLVNIIQLFNIKQYILLIIGQAVIILVIILQLDKLPDGSFHLLAFNIPIGDALLIETPDGHTIAIDGGDDEAVVHKLNERNSFFKRSIDALILTHPDDDHLNGALELLKNFQIKGIYMTGIECSKVKYTEFLKLAAAKGVQLVFLDKYSNFRAGAVDFQVLYPIESIAGRYFKHLNETSVIIRVKFGDKTIMLTGDAEKEVEKELLLTNFALSSNILKVGHHGSKSSTSDEFLQAISPEIAVVPAGFNNPFGHPHKEIMDKLSIRRIKNLVIRDTGDIDIVLKNNENILTNF